MRHIKDLVVEGYLSQAVRALRENLSAKHQERFKHQLCHLSYQLASTQKDARLGIAPYAEVRISENRIANSFLELVNELGEVVSFEKQEKKSYF